ncbi:hypothetical protein C2845_PM04G22400 [Panicum miliaceum]|uniref:Uncharacterized protein n=1 Tax=Panicum miliaceum TaxID=4540 RepID=A0A3L6QRL3_PANMI|nr:hypothetical protein C2845_PM04G22400 [Panicum miliaceum]
MTSLSPCRSLEIILGKHLHHQLSSMSKMRMCKAPELLKKAATVFRSKTEALRTKLVVLASLRRKLAVVRVISHRIHALVSSDRGKQARLEYGDGTLVLRKVATGILHQEQADHGHDDGVIDLSEVAMFEEDDRGYPYWTHSLFNDDEEEVTMIMLILMCSASPRSSTSSGATGRWKVWSSTWMMRLIRLVTCS